MKDQEFRRSIAEQKAVYKGLTSWQIIPELDVQNVLSNSGASPLNHDVRRVWLFRSGTGVSMAPQRRHCIERIQLKSCHAAWSCSLRERWCCPSKPTFAGLRRNEGHECTCIAAEVSLPGSIAAREQSLRRHAASQGHAVLTQTRPCSLKEAVRLMLFMPLAAALGKRLDQNAEMRLGMLFLHPETAHETESLIGGPPSQQPGKRKRGQTQALPTQSNW